MSSKLVCDSPELYNEKWIAMPRFMIQYSVINSRNIVAPTYNVIALAA